MKNDHRELKDLISIGPAMLRDFGLLNIRSVEQLAKLDAKKLYTKLGRVAGSTRTSAYWIRSKLPSHKPAIPDSRRNSASGGGGAGREKKEPRREIRKQ